MGRTHMISLLGISLILTLPLSACYGIDPCGEYCSGISIQADELCIYKDFAVKIRIVNETRARPRCNGESLTYTYTFEVLEHYIQKSPWRFEEGAALIGLQTRFNQVTCGERFEPGKTYILIADLEMRTVNETKVWYPYYTPCRHIRIDVEAEPARLAEFTQFMNTMCSQDDCTRTWECRYQESYS